MRPPFLALLALVACGTQRPKTDATTDDSGVLVDDDDGDGDGHAPPADCDDADPEVNPSAPETCDGVDQDCDGRVDEDAVDARPWTLDADGDTWGDDATAIWSCEDPGDGRVPDGGDCDDADPDRSPGETERCDGDDDDCDGEIDESGAVDALAFYVDGDGDGWGDATAGTLRACEVPAGYAERFGDCDDADPGAFPGALESCDGVDNDCDGQQDEGNATDAVEFHPDADGDGYGDPSTFTRACEAPAGHVDDAQDCDDADADVYPGALESCDDVDEDCDGQVDEQAEGAATWYADADRDGYGDAASTTLSCDRPGGHVSNDEDCDDADAATWPGAPEACGDGVINDCDGDVASALAQCSLTSTLDTSQADLSLIGVTAGDYAGHRVAGPGDVDGDGLDDLLVGAYRRTGSAGSQAGVVYLVLGGVTGAQALSSADAILEGVGASDNAGRALSAAGDVNGDGLADLLIGAPGNDDAARSAGAAYLVLGPVTGALPLSVADGELLGDTAYDALGTGVSGGGDADGDGLADLFVGATGDDRGGSGAGAVGFFSGASALGAFAFADAAAVFHGAGSGAGVGEVLASDGDLDGDGLADLAIGLPGDDSAGSNAGAVALFLGPGALSGDVSVDDADAVLTGGAAGDAAGSSVAIAGDFDGDGLADLLIGAPDEDSAARAAGAVWLVSGPPASGGPSQAAYTLLGSGASAHLGRSLCSAGDVDGDGVDDLLVGADYASGSTRYAGAAYLVLGGGLSGVASVTSADGQVEGTATYDYVGASVAAAGDPTGQGRPSVLIGAWGHDAGGSSAGAAFLMSGGDY